MPSSPDVVALLNGTGARQTALVPWSEDDGPATAAGRGASNLRLGAQGRVVNGRAGTCPGARGLSAGGTGQSPTAPPVTPPAPTAPRAPLAHTGQPGVPGPPCNLEPASGLGLHRPNCNWRSGKLPFVLSRVRIC